MDSFLWSESFWLPQGVNWMDITSNNSINYPQFGDLRYSIYCGVGLLFIRLFLECCIFLPIGYLAGWMPSSTNLPKQMLRHLLGGFAGKSKFKRVAETAWRFVFYLMAWLSGLYVLWNEPQLKDVTECWRNYPHHPISDAVWWYYTVETAFYWALLFSSITFDIRRADFIELTIHHIVTICLLGISWTINMVRVGTLVLFTHDVADILIELGKLCRYARWQKTMNVLYVIFMVLWLSTRLGYYPFVLIRSVLMDAPEFVQKNYRWENIWQPPIMPRLLVFMLCCLLVLHLFWTWVLIKIAVYTVRKGQMDDIREEDISDEDVKQD